jgi:hypothetical protein
MVAFFAAVAFIAIVTAGCDAAVSVLSRLREGI